MICITAALMIKDTISSLRVEGIHLSEQEVYVLE
ncbi:MAG: hypothetical protein ACI9G9_000346 [Psychromonas sp.]|jgi:hypothetical protein